MDRNLIQNQHEHSVWQTLFRPRRPRPHHPVISVSAVTQNLLGKQGFPNHQNQCRPGSRTSRPRLNLLRLNSQGEDNRSPPILLPSECDHQLAEVNFYHKEISINYSSKVNSVVVDCCGGECPSPPTNRRLQHILPASKDELNSIVEEIDRGSRPKQMFQRSSLNSSNMPSNINISNTLFKFAQLSTIMPNENKMQNTEFVWNSVPLTRGLPYFRPTIPVGLSASAILFGRYKQAERSIDGTNQCFMQTNMSPENKKKSEMCSITSSLSLAKSELAKLINRQKLTMNEQLPQSKQVARYVIEDSMSVLANEMSTDNSIKSEKMKQTSYEPSKENESLLEVSVVRQDNDDYQKKAEIIPRNLQIHDGQTETENSSCSEVTDLDNNEEDNISDEESDKEEEEYSSSDSDTSGPLSDFESDTESYDASSEYESDCDVDSDTESWSSDIKDPVPACQNAIVSFILGQCTDATGGKDSGFDECDEPSIGSSKNEVQVNEDHLWHSLNASGDPYNPINGWKCCSGSPFKSITPVNQLTESNHALPKLNADDIEPNCSISNNCILKKDIKLYKDADALIVEPNNVVPPGVVKTSCPVIKCLVSCTWPSNKTNLNNTVDKINCKDKSDEPTNVNITKSCFKNKWSRQEEKQTKKVSFTCKDISSIAYENPDWCDDYREMRKPYWESFARDRCRFHRRIKEVCDAISYCFNPNHRNKMMKKLQINT